MPAKCPTCHSENPDTKLFCGDCGTKLEISPNASPSFTKTLEAPSQGLTQGSVFAQRYKIVGMLGSGGMGQVYRAHDTQIEEDIAIKVLKPEIALDPRVLDRFRNELKFARKITHKSVCRMHDISVSGGTTYITMEFVEGEDLKSVIRRKGKLGIGQAVGVALQITDGLFEAHDIGIVHRDLKPQNIMIDPDGNAKIMDFGIARSTAAKGITREGAIIGTPEYMSPEQVEGQPVDQRSDIYSLGLILYEMLAGQVPFSGKTALDIALKHKTEEPEDPREINKKIPDALAGLILRSMAKDPKERIQNTGDLLKSLVAIEESLPTSERSAQKIIPRIAGRKAAAPGLKKILIPTAAVAAIVIIGMIAWRLLFPPDYASVTEGRPTVAVLYFKNNTGDASFDQWRMILPDLLTSDLMQSKYLKVVSQDQIYSFFDRKNLHEARNYSVEDLKELAEEVRATYIAHGALTKAGENFKLSLNLQRTENMELVGAVEASTRGEDNISTMVDDLTYEIKPLFGMTTEDIDNDIDENIADSMSPIPEAMAFYVNAQRAKAAFKYDEAIELLDKAVALDPDFAMAYWLKALLLINVKFENQMDQTKAIEDANRRAYEAAQRRPVTKKEQLKIEGLYHMRFETNFDLTMEKYKELVNLYPDDYDGNHYLGIFYVNRFEDRKVAFNYFDAVFRSGQAALNDYANLARYYYGMQSYRKAREILNQGLNDKFQNNFFLQANFAHSFTLEGKYERALEECDKLYLIDPLHRFNHSFKGKSYYYQEDFHAAEEEFSKLLGRENVDERTFGRMLLISLYKLQGRFNEVLEQVELSREDPNSANTTGSALIDIHMIHGNWEDAAKTCEEWNPSYAVPLFVRKPHKAAIIDAKLKRWDKAQAFVDELNNLLQDTSKIYWVNIRQRFVHDLQGRIELERGNYNRAIEHLEQAMGLISDIHHPDYAFHVEALARAYLKSGQIQKARSKYEQITILSEGRGRLGDLYAKSFYMLGKIAEELGEKKKAKKYYARLLELWKNADPGIPELEDAKTRIGVL